jgi:metal-responsive CopG/Arc/MetJ family transcriptional regulator
MRKLIVTLDEDLSKKLANYPNQSETIRKALNLYIDDISTPDTIEGLRKTYSQLIKYLEAKTEYYDYVFKQLEKLINMLETRI